MTDAQQGMQENMQEPGASTMPAIRKINAQDIVDALAKGLRDFQAYPAYGLFFGGIYAFGGLATAIIAFWWGLNYLIYPMAAGFVLIGPFVAVGLYEVSRRRERGEPITWPVILGAVFSQSGKEISWMAFVTLFIFMIWMYQVRLLIALFFGLHGLPAGSFPAILFTSPEGLAFLAVGHAVGAVLAILVFSLTVVSFPLLLDRPVDVVTAMITSVKSVVTNPIPMIGWALVVTLLIMAASLPAFLGLLIVLPVLGHTTWHLYRKIVV
jgi:uncharacterized membrane protein